MTREEAKKRLEVWLICGECPEDKQCYDSYLHSTCEYTDYCDEVSLTDAVKMAISALSENKGEWIPVSERLPKEENKSYWICTDYGSQCECRWTNVNHFWPHLTTDWHWHIMDIPPYSKVVAWMPLPESYEAEEVSE